MKYRHGFVSNSSSSSFICGTGVTVEEAEEIMKEIADIARRLGSSSWRHRCEYTVFTAGKYYADGWEGHYPEMEDAAARGLTIVESACDNAIGVDLWDSIEEKLGATRYHLG